MSSRCRVSVGKPSASAAGGDHADAVKADRRNRQPERFAQRRIGDRYSLATACASDFALHGGRNQIAASRVDGRWRHNDVNGRTLAREADIDEVRGRSSMPARMRRCRRSGLGS